MMTQKRKGSVEEIVERIKMMEKNHMTGDEIARRLKNEKALLNNVYDALKSRGYLVMITGDGQSCLRVSSERISKRFYRQMAKAGIEPMPKWVVPF
jgi:hypothetical protein